MQQSSNFSRPTKVKNKTPAEVQITAEQILREAHDRSEPLYTQPKQQITDEDELLDYRFNKRKTFEDSIRRNKYQSSHYLKYAAWEEAQGEMDRARSVLERSLEVEPRNPSIWIKYAEMEMKHKNINLARNLWDRACTQLPRVDQFWYKYAYMEEMLNNHAKARQIFERWMAWRPGKEWWEAYIAFELRYREKDRARSLYERMVECHPDTENWIAFAKFEEDQSRPESAREIFERAISYLGDDHISAVIFTAFARFETRQREIERARAIYTYALQHLPKSQAEALYRAYTQFEKTHGDRKAIETAVATKRRHIYLEELATNPHNIDAWMDLIRVDEDSMNLERARDSYERAIANVPPTTNDKRIWRRYSYLWLQYAAFEEVRALDFVRTRAVYEAAVQIVPHKSFTFAKLWLAYARFLIRQRDLASARKLLGMALGVTPKPKLFKGYIDLEIQLREFDRVRTLYEKFCLQYPAYVYAWVKYAELEKMLGDIDRARAIFDIGANQLALDMPEVLWKAYIDFEVDEGEWDKARNLYERLLQRTTHVKVWISFAKFEMEAEQLEDLSVRVPRSRTIFQRAYKLLKEQGANEERVALIESWRDFERQFGALPDLTAVSKMFPKVIKRRRPVTGSNVTANDSSTMTEEYLEYIWPDDEVRQPNLKLLAKAHQWKAAMAAKAGAAAIAAQKSNDNSSPQDDITVDIPTPELATFNSASMDVDSREKDDESIYQQSISQGQD